MKLKITTTILFFATLMTILVGCTQKDTSTDAYKTISADEAKEMMDENPKTTILDVRTQEEFNTGHIEGALLIPYEKIAEGVKADLTDQSATILVYCRSGRRSAIASKTLADLGYTDVYDFGGVLDWNYELVIE